MRIGVVGLGQHGLSLAMVLQEYGGHQVIGFDTDPARVSRMMGPLYLDNPHLHPDLELCYLLREARPLPLAPTMRTLIRYSDVIYLTVPALGPNPPVHAAFQDVMGGIPADETRLVVMGRKVPVGTSRKLFSPFGLPWAFHGMVGPKDGLVTALTNPDHIDIGTDELFYSATGLALRNVWTPVVNTAPVRFLPVEFAESILHNPDHEGET